MTNCMNKDIENEVGLVPYTTSFNNCHNNCQKTCQRSQGTAKITSTNRTQKYQSFFLYSCEVEKK